LKIYRKKLLGTGVILSVITLSIMVLFFVSVYRYGESHLVTEVMKCLIGIFGLSLMLFLFIFILSEAKLNRYKWLKIGECKWNECKYCWTSCVIVGKFSYLICKNFIHNVIEEIEKLVE